MVHRAAALSVLSLGLSVALFGVSGNLQQLNILPTDAGWTAWLTSTAVVSLLGAVVSLIYYYKILKLTERNADRAVIVDAQKLLLEINKLLVGEPNLFAIYDSDKSEELLKNNNTLKEKVKAFGYMHLNVFEMVFAQLPKGKEYETWRSYFHDSLKRCTLLGTLLKDSAAIYHPNLKKIYEEWNGAEKKRKGEENGK